MMTILLSDHSNVDFVDDDDDDDTTNTPSTILVILLYIERERVMMIRCVKYRYQCPKIPRE